MTRMERLIVDEENGIELEVITHDHGTLRDGPCFGCEALALGGVSCTCSECNGTGASRQNSKIDCFGCDGNFSVVQAPEGTIARIKEAEDAKFAAILSRRIIE